MIKIVKLTPEKYSKYHFGCGKNKISENFQSDKLFSAVINNGAMLFKKDNLDKLLEAFKSGNIIFSDLIIGIEMNTREHINFFPKPASIEFKENFDVIERLEGKKELRKVKYFSEGVIKELRYNNSQSNLEIDYAKCNIYGNLVITKEEEKKIGEKGLKELKGKDIFIFDAVPRVLVDRNTLSSRNLFFEDYMTINEFNNLKIYYSFYMYINENSLEKEIVENLYKSINIIKTEGLGGKRSRGYGLFKEIEIKSIKEENLVTDIFKESGKKLYMSISTFIPEEKNIVNNLLAYSISQRNGFIYSNGMTKERKKSAFVLDSGLISKKSLVGNIIDVNIDKMSIEHEVYLNGKSIFINIGSDFSG